MLGVPGFAPAGLALEMRGYASFISQSRRIDTEVRHLGDTMGLVATRAQRFTQAMGVLGIAFIAVGAGLTALLKPAIEASDELRRLDIMGRGVASGMAISTEAILAERKELAQLDVTAVQALRSLNALTMMHVDFTKASDLATAALDVAAFTGEKVNKVYEAFTRAVANASTLGLRAYKITATTEKVFAAFARTLGKTARELTMVERRQAVLNYILAVSARVAGAWAATAETLWGQLQRLNVAAANLAATAGVHLIPVLVDLLKYANELVRRFDALPEQTKKVIVAFAAKAAVILSVAGAVALLLPVLKLLTSAFVALAQILWTVVIGALAKVLTALFTLGLAGWAVAAAIAAVVVAIKTNWLGLGDWLYQALDLAGVKEWAEGLIAPFRIADQEIRKITGKLSDEDYGFDWAPGELFDDLADRAKRAAKEALWAVQDVLFDLATRALELAKVLYPFEDALTRIRAAADRVVIPLERQRRALERQLRVLEKIVDAERERAEQRLRELDLVLRPFEDALTRIRALADLVVIPLERQRRVLQRQVDELEKIAKAERERAERRLRELERQEEALRELVKADKERLDYLDHEIFMEQQRNKILGKATSARLLELMSQRAVSRDQAASRKEELSGISDARRAEKERLDELKTAAEKQIEAVQKRIDALTESIELEEERVLYAKEALRLEQARQAEMRLAAEAALEALKILSDKQQEAAQAQIDALTENIELAEERVLWAEETLRLEQARHVEARLALLAETRFWKEEQRQAQHALDIINRIPDAIRAIAEAWTFGLPGVPAFPEPGAPVIPEVPTGVLPALPGIPKDWEETVTRYAEVNKKIQGEQRERVQRHLRKLRELWNEAWRRWDEDRRKQRAENKEKWEAYWPIIEAGWAAFWAEVGKIASDFWTGFTAFWKEQWIAFKTWWDERWIIFKAGWKTFWGEVRTLVEEFWIGFAEFWEEQWEAYKARLALQWEALKLAWKETYWAKVLALAKEWWEEFKTWWGEQKEGFKQLGKDLVDGIRKGIEDKWESFKSWLSSKVKGLISAALKAIGGGSPARLAIPVGESIVEGFQEGMTRALRRMSERISPVVAANLASGLGRVSSVAAAAPTYNYYYITHEAPSVSVQASYARAQTVGSIYDDVNMALAMVR